MAKDTASFKDKSIAEINRKNVSVRQMFKYLLKIVTLILAFGQMIRENLMKHEIMAYEGNWTKPETEILISILERYPVLYQSSHEDYSKMSVKDKACEEIVAELKDVKPDITAYSVKRKVKTLRSQLWAEARKMRAKSRTGPADEVYQPKLWCYNLLQFLLQSNEEEIEEVSNVQSVKDYIDIDQTILEPSPQRIRNILTLEERVAAIEAYDCRPMYTKVAKMFNCSWEQIKNIIANRDAIMEFYLATRSAEAQKDPSGLEIRSRKIRFLGECLYEYIQRAQFHTKAHVTEELLRMKAIEFRDIIQIENFMPNKAWINHFKATYNFSLSNRQITITRTPPTSLDLKDIMTYCTKNKAKADAEAEASIQVSPVHEREPELYRTTTRIAISVENKAALLEVKQRRLRKINFLTKALFEYWQRAKHHQKREMNENSLRKVAIELKDMLKIDDFYPDKEWLDHYVTITYPTMIEETQDSRPPPLSLDLKDILSYCSRQENKKQAPSTITLAPKETTKQWASDTPVNTSASAPTTTPLVQIHTFNLRRSDESFVPTSTTSPKQLATTLATRIKEEVIELDADGEGRDVKPNLSELQSPLLSSPATQTQKIPPTIPAATVTTVPVALVQVASSKTNSTDCVSQAPALRVVSLSTLVPPPASLPPQPPLVIANGATTPPASISRKRKSSDIAVSLPQPLKIQKIESIGVHVEQTAHSPGHWSEHSDREEEELPRHVTNYKDALKLLKPLEEFAMLEENYRVIGLISQLEEIFKHPPPKDEN